VQVRSWKRKEGVESNDGLLRIFDQHHRHRRARGQVALATLTYRCPRARAPPHNRIMYGTTLTCALLVHHACGAWPRKHRAWRATDTGVGAHTIRVSNRKRLRSGGAPAPKARWRTVSSWVVNSVLTLCTVRLRRHMHDSLTKVGLFFLYGRPL
jgi:hypothetical protein